MAIDSEAKRRNVVRLPHVDGSVSDRDQFAVTGWFYTGQILVIAVNMMSSWFFNLRFRIGF